MDKRNRDSLFLSELAHFLKEVFLVYTKYVSENGMQELNAIRLPNHHDVSDGDICLHLDQWKKGITEKLETIYVKDYQKDDIIHTVSLIAHLNTSIMETKVSFIKIN